MMRSIHARHNTSCADVFLPRVEPVSYDTETVRWQLCPHAFLLYASAILRFSEMIHDRATNAPSHSDSLRKRLVCIEPARKQRRRKDAYSRDRQPQCEAIENDGEHGHSNNNTTNSMHKPSILRFVHVTFAADGCKCCSRFLM